MRKTTLASATLATVLGLALAGCGGVPSNRTMYSVHQPVVQKSEYTVDLNTSGYGLAAGEQGRLAGWFETMGVKSGDHIVIDDADASPATRSAIEAVAQHYGATIDDTIASGMVNSGTVRVTLGRARAYVPGCPDWSAKSDFNPGNATSTNYGCAVNSNLAAMVADPEDLVRGQTDTGSTQSMTSNKAINAYRNAAPTGNGNTVTAVSTKSGN